MNRATPKTLLWALLLLWFLPLYGAGVEPREFPAESLRERYLDLIRELRCLVCQNQNLADSDADLAKDLRQRVYQMLLDEKSDEEIVAFMVARYGDFVRYRPPFNQATFLLWCGPVVLAAAGFGLLVWQIRRHRETPEPPRGDEYPGDEDLHRAKALLDRDPGPGQYS